MTDTGARRFRTSSESPSSNGADRGNRLSEEKYRLISEKTSDLIALATFDSNPVYTYISPSHTRILGSDPRAVVGKPCLAYLHPEDQEKLSSLLKKHLEARGKSAQKESEITETIEYRVRSLLRQGEWRYLQSTVNIVGDELLFVSRDITDRKRAEQALQQTREELERRVKERTLELSQANENLLKHIAECKRMEQALQGSELLYRKTIDAISDAIHVVDRNLRILLVNENFRQWNQKLGLKTDMIGRTIFEIFPFLPARVKYEYEKVFTTGEMLVTEEVTKIGDTEITTEARKIPVFENGSVVKIVTCIRDITEAKQALAILRKTEQEKALILDSISEHVVYYDKNMSVVWANGAICKSVGCAPDTLVGRHCYEIGFKRTRPCEGCPVIEALTTGQPHVGEMETADGKLWFLRGYPVRHSDGTVEGVVQVSLDVTVIRKAEEALRESELRYRALFERGLLCIYVHNLEGRFLDANDAALILLGYARDEIPTVSFDTLLTEDQIPKAREIMQGIIKHGYQTEVIEFKLRTKSGGYVWVETEATLLYKEGKPFAIQGIARDITTRKQAEAALRESEEMYKSLITASPDAIVVSDLQGKIMYASEQAAKLGGISDVQELLGKNSFDFIDPIDQKRAVLNLQKTLETGYTKNLEYMLVRSDGSRYVGEMSAALIRDAQGKPKAFIATLRDITERKEAEEALRDSEEKYKTLTDNVNVGIYRNTVGPKGKFIEANPAIIKMFGYSSKEEFLSINVADLYQNPEHRALFNGKMLAMGFVRNEELLLKKKDGTPFFGSVSAVAVKDVSGTIKYYDGIIEDITERKKSEEDLRASYDRLRAVLDGTVNALASTAEKRDPYTAGHQQRVTYLAVAIARELGLSETQIQGIKVAGIVHDIGKIHVAAEILNKPTRLTQIEMDLVKTHSQAGYEILKTIEFPWPVAEIVLQHHEKMDGSGYPRGLTCDDIIIEARILSVADVVEAMTAHRPYRSALSLEVALSEVKDHRGTWFDPEVVDACMHLFEKGFDFQ